jgi:uncharacterized delta-60 repeat protein
VTPNPRRASVHFAYSFFGSHKALLRQSVWVPWLGGVVLLCLALAFAATEAVKAQGSPGTLSFTQSTYSVNEGGGSASITLSRVGGTDGEVTAKVSLADVTTSSADYVFKPGLLDPTIAEVTEAVNSFLYYSGQIALQPDGKILLGAARAIVRLNPDGAPDPTFTAGATNAGVSSIAVQTDGKIVIGGFFTTIGGVSRRGVARLNADGTLDNTFDVGVGSTDVQMLAIQDGKVLVGGNFSSFNLAPNTSNLARLNTDGSVDSGFLNAAGVGPIYAIKVYTDGRIVLGGLSNPSVVRLNPDGSADNAFSSNLGNPVLALALQSDGKVLAGGGFDHAGAQGIFNLARLNADGSLDGSFNPGSGPDFAVEAIAVQPDGRIIVGGDFRTFNGSTAVNLLRLNAGGGLDSTFIPNITSASGSFVHGLVLQPDGKILAAGSFSMSGSGATRRNLARVNGDLFAQWKNGEGGDKTVSLPIVDDLLDEPDETLALTLTPLGAATAGAIANATLTIVDNDVPPAITSGAPPQGITRLSYTHTFTATGTPSPTFAVTSGTLPQGLFLQSSGVLSGTPSTAGTFSDITVTASNGIAPAATQTFSITILSGGMLQFSSATYSVAEDGGSATITVTRTGGTAGATAVSFSTSSGSAGGGFDFTNTSGTLNFADGEVSKTFTVHIIEDSIDEMNETVNLFINSITGSGQGGSPVFSSLTITDNDPPPTVSISDVVLTEGNGGTKAATFTLTLSADSSLFITVNYETANNTATASSDYQAVAGSVTFLGTTTSTISVFVLGDATVEPDESFFVNLTSSQNVTIARSQAQAIIINDDNNGGNPIDLNGFFVRQHYADFLNRQPDIAGLNFWVGELESCGTDQACIGNKRVNVSAAFYLSIEFQQTGYLVERIYKAAYGDASGTSTQGGAHQLSVPIVRFNEFQSDTQNIAQFVVVNQPGWEAVLESNKVAFINQFVQRFRFTAAFPNSLTAAQFVDKLNANAGNPLSSAERDQLVIDLTNSVKTRAQVLRAVAEDSDLDHAESNRAFVLMQYFGYLRRNPNDGPDSDYTGYEFWLNKLNEFNGNFVNAEMVKAFIVSGEYRQRFGP